MIHLILVALFTLSPLSRAYSTGWSYSWPSSTAQCDAVTLYIYGGVPPWTLAVIPIGGQPTIWQVQAGSIPATITDPVNTIIPLELAAGTPYTVLMADQNGINGGSGTTNPVLLQIVQPSTNTSCLGNGGSIPREFDFAVSGDLNQCSNDFGINWWDGVGRAPYSMTVVPLDTSFNPWRVAFTGGSDMSTTPDRSWQVNMTSGTKFTIVMSNADGFGRGGVGGVYQVTQGTNTTCITQSYQGSLSLPDAVNVTSLNPTTTVSHYSSTSTGGSSGSQVVQGSTGASGSASAGASGGSQKGGLSMGAIIGIAVGAGVLGIAIVGGLIWFLCRRKRQQREQSYPAGRNLDLVDEGHSEPKIDPFPGGAPTEGYGQEVPYAGGATPFRDSMSEFPTTPGPGSTYAPGPGSAYMAASQMTTDGHSGLSSPNALSPAAFPTATPTGRPLPNLPVQHSLSVSSAPSSSAGGGEYSEGQRQYSEGDRLKSAYIAADTRQSRASTMETEEPEYVRHTDGGASPSPTSTTRERIELPPLYEQVPSRSPSSPNQ